MNEIGHAYMEFVRKVLARIKYRDWKIVATRHRRKAFIHVEFFAVDATTEQQPPLLQQGRPMYLGEVGEKITADQIIGTVYLAIKIVEDHEREEFFKVDGIPLNNPHISTAARQEAYFRTFPQGMGASKTSTE